MQSDCKKTKSAEVPALKPIQASSIIVPAHIETQQLIVHKIYLQFLASRYQVCAIDLKIVDCFDLEPIYHILICACHPCAGATLIFSVSFQFHQMSTNVLLQKIAYRNEMKIGLMSSGLRRLALFQDTTICVSLF